MPPTPSSRGQRERRHPPVLVDGADPGALAQGAEHRDVQEQQRGHRACGRSYSATAYAWTDQSE